MKKVILTLAIVTLFLFGCSRPTLRKTAKNPFTHDVLIKTTPVKNQGRSPLCWAYAMLATIESEHLMMGDSVHLSTDYIARMLLMEQARESYFANENKKISLRGTASMTLNLLNRYGILHYDSYHNKEVNYNVVARKVEQASKTANNLQQLTERVNDILDQEVDYMPRIVYFLHAEYTAKEFAHSVCLPNEYLSLTSFTHHPYNESFVLEIPDNQLKDTFLNIHIDTLMTHIKQALQNGHPVCWEGDVSEPGFSFTQGIAVLENQRANITPKIRQQQFEALKTTDDHCMELIGLAHDKDGNPYFIAKNSWGNNNPYKGRMYLSEPYVRLQTIAAYMSRDAYAQ